MWLQRFALDAVMRARLAPRFALFQMFLRTLEEIGADRQELEAALARCTDVGPSFVATFRALAERGGDASYRAVVYALLADWATSEPYEREKNYAIAVPAFEQFARAHQPRIERIDLPFRETALSAYWMTPHATPSTAGARRPTTTSPKSGWSRWPTPPARVGSAALVIDLPGYGESFLRGSRFDGVESLRATADADRSRFISSRGITRPGVFGVSLSGMLAHLLASLNERVVALRDWAGPRICHGCGITCSFTAPPFHDRVWRRCDGRFP